jgi:hypothetical protein
MREESMAKPRPAGKTKPSPPPAREAGGPTGPDPVRYGDWERKGIAVDF